VLGDLLPGGLGLYWLERVLCRLRRTDVLLVLLDDAGFGQPDAFGGPIAAPLQVTGRYFHRHPALEAVRASAWP
jgi:arylsulfatase A-like enzyme